MDVATITLRDRDRTIEALWVAPGADRTAPGVLLVHDAWGLDEEAARIAAAIGAAGFAVLAPDLLAGHRAATPDEARALAAGLDSEDAITALAAALDALAAGPRTRPGSVGAVGVGMGAPLVAFLATVRPEIAAVVLAGPAPDLPLEAWARAEADVVALVATGADDDPALDGARVAGRRVERVEAADDQLGVVAGRILAARLGA